MEIKKWSELDKKKKVMIGIGSAVAVTAIGAGVGIAVSGDEPDDEQSSMDPTEKQKQAEQEEKAIAEKQANETKTSISEKEDGTKVTVSQSTGKTPTATVEVEKKNNEKNGDNTNTNDTEKGKENTQSNEKGDTSKESDPKPEKKPEPKDVITTKTTTESESIGFKTIEQKDNTLEKGKTKVVQEGQKGVRTITYKETYKNGKLVSKEKVSSKVTKQPVDKIIKVGTKEPAPKVSYLSASEAHKILTGVGLFEKFGNEYVYDPGMSGYISVRVGKNHVQDIYFEGYTYQACKNDNSTLEELIKQYGEELGREAYEYRITYIKNYEAMARAAANAVYGKGTAQANALYQEILQQSMKKNSTFYREF